MEYDEDMPMGASAQEAKEQHDWRAEDDLRTLMEAEKIRMDPDRITRAKAMARKKRAELLNIGKNEDEGMDED